MSDTTISAMLISLSFTFGKQGGKDKEMTRDQCERIGGADEKAVTVNRIKICKEALAPLKSLTGEWRNKLTRITSHWDIPGVHLCSAINVPKAIVLRDEYTPLLNVKKASHLLERLPEWKELTKFQTKGAFKESEFPTKDELIRSVTWTMGVMPLPESEAIRRVKDLGETLMEELTKSHNARIQTGIREGMAEAYTKLMEPLQNMVKNLSKDKVKVYETLVDNLKAVVAEIPGLNLVEDHQLSRFAEEAQSMLSNIDADSLRDSPVLRRDTVAKANDLLATFGQPGLRRFSIP